MDMDMDMNMDMDMDRVSTPPNPCGVTRARNRGSRRNARTQLWFAA